MGLGSNRDYTTRDRNVRRSIAVVNAYKLELMQKGMDESLALQQAMSDLRSGLLKSRLKAWKDPILEHRRKMAKQRKEQE